MVNMVADGVWVEEVKEIRKEKKGGFPGNYNTRIYWRSREGRTTKRSEELWEKKK